MGLVCSVIDVGGEIDHRHVNTTVARYEEIRIRLHTTPAPEFLIHIPTRRYPVQKAKLQSYGLNYQKLTHKINDSPNLHNVDSRDVISHSN